MSAGSEECPSEAQENVENQKIFTFFLLPLLLKKLFKMTDPLSGLLPINFLSLSESTNCFSSDIHNKNKLDSLQNNCFN